MDHQTILNAMDHVIRIIGASYGPKGRTVMMQRSGGLISTKDGASILWELWPPDRREKLFVTMIQDAVAKFNVQIGDGTTTAALFCALLTKALVKRKVAGEAPQSLSNDLQMISSLMEDVLLPIRKMVESEQELRELAFHISNRDAEIADTVSRALLQTGSKGMVVVDDGKSRTIEVVQKRGYQTESRVESLDLLKDSQRIFDTCLVACVDGSLTKMEEIVPILEEATGFPYPLVIFSRGIFGEALKTLCLNDRHLKREDGSLFEVCAVRVPGRTDQMRSFLEDLASISGSTIWTPGMIPFESFMLGSFQKASIKKDRGIFYPNADREDGILRRIAQLERLSESTDSTHDRDQIMRRVAFLADGFVVLEVGGATFTEIRERKSRVEDVLSVSKVILEEGIVPGGGMAFLWLWDHFRKLKSPAAQAFAEACFSLWKFLVREEYVISSKLDLTTPWIGFDVVTKTIRDFSESPILADSFEGTLQILQMACSVANMIVSVERVILK